MPEIAHTTVGRNGLFLGLISHITAILVAMMPAPGSAQFFEIVFPVSCLFLIIAIYSEFRHRGFNTIKQWRFYVAAAAAAIPLLGPLFVSGVLYGFQKSEDARLTKIFGFIPALFKLRGNMLTGFALIVALLILFVLTAGGR